MVNRRSKEASGMVVRFQEDSEDQPGEDVEINISRSCTDLHEASSRPDIRLHHTMPGRLRPQLSCEGQLMSDRAHLIGRACWSGGWQNTILNRRREGIGPANEEEEIYEISQAMRVDTKFMADTVDGEIMRRNTFREMTKSLKLRRELKQRLTLTDHVDHRVKPMKNVQDYFSAWWISFQRTMVQFLHDNSLWHGSIVQIEGIFGRNVGAFFHFLRDLVILNFLMSLIVCGFLLVPQLLQDFYRDPLANAPISFGGLDWITGTGWFDMTALYYGGYSAWNSTSFDTTSQYNMTHAYFFAITMCLLTFLVILLVRVCNLYKDHYINVMDDANCNFTRLLFSGWDFRISDPNTAKIKRNSLYNELMESIQELLEEEEVDSFYRYLKRKAIQVFTWLILTSFVSLISWGMYVFLTKEYNNFVRQDISYIKESFNFLIFPFVVTVIMYGVPLIFDAVGRQERYMKKQTALYVTLVRFTMLELVILAVLFIFWYGNSPGLIDELPTLQISAQRQIDSVYTQDANNTSSKCWESALGQEMYRLVLIDFIFLAMNVLVVNIVRTALVQRGKLQESILEFNISGNILHLIYNQTLLWAGIFFCPLLPAIITVKFICIFYLHKFDLTRNLRPNTRPWRASQSETLFNSLALFSLILAIFGYGFIIVRGYSSDNCGPFREYTHYIDCLWAISVDSERIILHGVKWLFRPVSIFVMLGFLSILVICAKNIAEGRIEMVANLRHQVQLEIEDKKFYIALMDQVQRGNYKPGTPIRDLPPATSPIRNRDLDSSNLSKRASFTFSKGDQQEESAL